MNSLPYFQMGSNVIWNTMPYLGWCARAYTLVKKDLLLHQYLQYDISHALSSTVL